MALLHAIDRVARAVFLRVQAILRCAVALSDNLLHRHTSLARRDCWQDRADRTSQLSERDLPRVKTFVVIRGYDLQ